MSKKERIKYKKPWNVKTFIKKIIIYSLVALSSVISFSLIPKSIFESKNIYENAVANAVYENKTDSALYEYKVYGNQARLDEGLKKEIPIYIEKFRQENRILLVKIPGEKYHFERHEEYLFVKDKTVPKLNIEFHVVKNVRYDDNSFATETFLSVKKLLAEKGNLIYFILISTFHIVIFIIFVTLIVKNIFVYKKEKNNKK